MGKTIGNNKIGFKDEKNLFVQSLGRWWSKVLDGQPRVFASEQNQNG